MKIVFPFIPFHLLKSQAIISYIFLGSNKKKKTILEKLGRQLFKQIYIISENIFREMFLNVLADFHKNCIIYDAVCAENEVYTSKSGI